MLRALLLLLGAFLALSGALAAAAIVSAQGDEAEPSFDAELEDGQDPFAGADDAAFDEAAADAAGTGAAQGPAEPAQPRALPGPAWLAAALGLMAVAWLTRRPSE